MKLHAKPSKFHIEHTPNGATVQHIHTKQVIATICPKQQLGILQSWKQHAKGPQQENKIHGHYVQVKHYKTWTLSYLLKSLEHAQTHMVRLQVITISDMHGSLAKHMATTELNVNRLTATLSSNFGARKQQATASYNCNQGHGWIEHNM